MSMRLLFKKYLMALMCLAFIAAGCGDDNDDNNGAGGTLTDAGSDANQATDGSQDNGGADAGEDAEEDTWTPECGEGQEYCDGACVDVLASADHCGGCGQTCRLFAECDQGTCLCDNAEHTYCDGYCVDTNVDPVNCGECGKTCAEGTLCDQGRCMSEPELVTEATNAARSTETNCDTEGVFAATGALQLDPELSKAAQAHAEDMAANEFMGHEGSDGSDFVERINRTNFQGQPLGENVAAGYTSSQEVVDGWVDSDGHCRNLMNPDATKIGVGYIKEEEAGEDNMKTYWVQLFGK